MIQREISILEQVLLKWSTRAYPIRGVIEVKQSLSVSSIDDQPSPRGIVNA